MPKIVLTYFDIDASRGEAPRLAMIVAGLPFDDRRIPRLVRELENATVIHRPGFSTR